MEGVLLENFFWLVRDWFFEKKDPKELLNPIRQKRLNCLANQVSTTPAVLENIHLPVAMTVWQHFMMLSLSAKSLDLPKFSKELVLRCQAHLSQLFVGEPLRAVAGQSLN